MEIGGRFLNSYINVDSLFPQLGKTIKNKFNLNHIRGQLIHCIQTSTSGKCSNCINVPTECSSENNVDVDHESLGILKSFAEKPRLQLVRENNAHHFIDKMAV